MLSVVWMGEVVGVVWMRDVMLSVGVVWMGEVVGVV